MTKLQLGLAGAVAVATATGLVVQAESGARLREEIDLLQQENRQAVVLRQENERLASISAEAVELRNDDVELARLRDEADALRTKLQAAGRAKAANANSAAPAAAGPVYDLNQLDQIPQPQFRTPPTYPREMRQAGVGGEVVVDFVVDANGSVVGARAVKSTQREFEEAAVAAVSKWTFRPGRKSQAPVNTHMQIPIVFTLQADRNAPVRDWF